MALLLADDPAVRPSPSPIKKIERTHLFKLSYQALPRSKYCINRLFHYLQRNYKDSLGPGIKSCPYSQPHLKCLFSSYFMVQRKYLKEEKNVRFQPKLNLKHACLQILKPTCVTLFTSFLTQLKSFMICLNLHCKNIYFDFKPTSSSSSCIR